MLCAGSRYARNAHGEKCAARIRAPLLAIENSADDAVPQPHTRHVFDAAASRDKELRVLRGATHYCVGQPELMHQAIDLTLEWLARAACTSVPLKGQALIGRR